MTDQQRMMFMNQMSTVRKDPTTGLLLAFFLGGVRAHKFYLGQTGLGILYVVFCFTLIPGLIALIECFVIKERVRRYNEQKAYEIALMVRAAFPAVPSLQPAMPLFSTVS